MIRGLQIGASICVLTKKDAAVNCYQEVGTREKCHFGGFSRPILYLSQDKSNLHNKPAFYYFYMDYFINSSWVGQKGPINSDKIKNREKSEGIKVLPLQCTCYHFYLYQNTMVYAS